MATAARGGAASVRSRPLDVGLTRDRALLRVFLERDRLRAAYAICDLEDREFARSRWGIATDAGEPVAVVLEYGGITPQPVFAIGAAEAVEAILRQVIRPRTCFVAADAALLPAIEQSYRLEAGPPMLRMWVDRVAFRPVEGVTARLAPDEIGDLNRLYGLGFSAGLPASAIADGVYYGVRLGGRLIAAAGTHVISSTARLAAVGNVMTDAAHRGRGLAKITTSAVTAELLRRGCDEVVLNVRSDNPPAIAAYQALGYREYCRFEERLARRRWPGWDSIVAPLRRLITRSKEKE
ncbi:MAG TPA: GNAT family N-acetyltransferase [Candidatus Limnocylindria bacterium]|nr:GNAT family N-acetyltransferase [Candidatus Limnocylindria bacterium]